MTRPRLSPRSEAIAYRAAMWCRDHGWEHTLQEVADAIGVPWRTLKNVSNIKGWNNRFRISSWDYISGVNAYKGTAYDGHIHDLQSWS